MPDAVPGRQACIAYVSDEKPEKLMVQELAGTALAVFSAEVGHLRWSPMVR